MKNLAMAVVLKESRVLVQYRYRSEKGMVYEFPGGSINNGESSENAAKRELFEETGVGAEGLIATAQYSSTNEYGGFISHVILTAKKSVKPVVTNSVRNQTFYWFQTKEIPLSDFYPADIEFIETQLINHL